MLGVPNIETSNNPDVLTGGDFGTVIVGPLKINGSFGTTGQVLTSGGETGNPSWADDNSGSPAGNDTEIQFNDDGVFGASSNLTFANGALTVGDPEEDFTEITDSRVTASNLVSPNMYAGDITDVMVHITQDTVRSENNLAVAQPLSIEGSDIELIADTVEVRQVGATSFTNTAGNVTYATVNAATTAAVSTDVVRLSDMQAFSAPKVVQGGDAGTIGLATLSGGTVTVSTTAAAAGSRIFLSDAGGTITNIGFHYVDPDDIVPGTSFTIKSVNVLDASDVFWMIVNP